MDSRAPKDGTVELTLNCAWEHTKGWLSVEASLNGRDDTIDFSYELASMIELEAILQAWSIVTGGWIDYEQVVKGIRIFADMVTTMQQARKTCETLSAEMDRKEKE